MAKELKAYGFNGMDNLSKSPGYFMDDKKRITPKVVLNADVFDEGVVRRRTGHALHISLPGAHSLWSDGEVMLCIATGAGGAPALFLIQGATAYEIAEITGPTKTRMDYVRVGSTIYLSNGYWKGTYDLAYGIGEWGLPVPMAPNLNLTTGDLPVGIYKVCYTHYLAPSRLGGAGAVAEIEIATGTQGIALVNQPSGTLAWITQPNGSKLYLAPVSGGVISNPNFTVPLPTEDVIPPEAMICLVLAHGRIWGASGKTLHYSDEFLYEHFRRSNRIPFAEEIVLLAPINNGMFVCSRKKTWLLKGTSPDKFAVEDAGDGAIPGTLSYALVEGSGYEISKKLSQTPSPLWMTEKGVVVGTHTGHLVHLTETRLRINPMSRGAAISQVLNNETPHTLISLYGSARGDFDQDLHGLFDRGRIYIPSPAVLNTYGGVIIGGEGDFA